MNDSPRLQGLILSPSFKGQSFRVGSKKKKEKKKK